ncbi:MAG: Gram-positive signal peptide protein family, partial [Thermodesulfobacteriota bacterium]|nr:Gram-positive signal peptide protein family [Thermodesulfobacteriota bacterium]
MLRFGLKMAESIQDVNPEKDSGKQVADGIRARIVPLLVLILCLATLLIGSLRIIGRGFEPYDDALRHVAKVVSGKAWTDILVIRPEITMDSHPGWHAILDAFQKLTLAEPDDILVFSILLLFLLFASIPV